jgi:haloacetate dehalogenase
MLETFVPLQIKTSGASIHVMKGGSGEPLLLLHGYPQTHVMWHKIAPRLAESFTVVLADLRGYGDSSKPKGEPDHANYSKRVMAQDMIEVMSQLGYESFRVVGHDRGARVTHRMLLDHAQRIQQAAVLDVVPTYEMFTTTDKAFATVYYHWFFLIQPAELASALDYCGAGILSAQYSQEPVRGHLGIYAGSNGPVFALLERSSNCPRHVRRLPCLCQY